MALADLLGLGGQPEMFTDWETARDFVIYKVIVPNPRIDDDTKVKLQQFEQKAYQETSGQILKSERKEIAEYWNFLQNGIRTYTNDKGILDVFEIASDTAKDVADPTGAAGIEIDTAAASRNLAAVALFGLGLWYVFLKK